MFAVALHEVQAIPVLGKSALASPQHLSAQVEADHFPVREVFQDAGREPAGAATDIENAFFSRLEFLHHQAVTRLEQEILQRVSVIASAPSIEFIACILRVISHRCVLHSCWRSCDQKTWESEPVCTRLP